MKGMIWVQLANDFECIKSSVISKKNNNVTS